MNTSFVLDKPQVAKTNALRRYMARHPIINLLPPRELARHLRVITKGLVRVSDAMVDKLQRHYAIGVVSKARITAWINGRRAVPRTQHHVQAHLTEWVLSELRWRQSARPQ